MDLTTLIGSVIGVGCIVLGHGLGDHHDSEAGRRLNRRVGLVMLRASSPRG